jgi:hypothetical protein
MWRNMLKGDWLILRRYVKREVFIQVPVLRYPRSKLGCMSNFTFDAIVVLKSPSKEVHTVKP